MHYMQCKGDQYQTSRKEGWNIFRKSMKKYKKEKSMMQAIYVGLQNYAYNDHDGAVPDMEYLTGRQHELLTDAFQAQNEIGWEQFLVGRIALGWKEFYRTTVEDEEFCDGLVTSFSRNLVNSIWKYTMSVWKSHNDINHGNDSQFSIRDKRALRECIYAAYTTIREHVSAEDAWLFREEARSRTEQHVPQMIGWLERVVSSVTVDDDDNDTVELRICLRKIRNTIHGLCMKSL